VCLCISFLCVCLGFSFLCVSVCVLWLVAYDTGGMLLCFFEFEIDSRKEEMPDAAAETAITFVFSVCVVACRL